MSRSLPTCVLALIACLVLPACADDAADPDGAGASADGRDAGRARDAGPTIAARPHPLVCDVNPPRTCDPADKPTFADVKPIIEQRCLSCHDGTGKEWPLLSYEHVASWYSQIRDAMRQCTMPPADSGVTMPAEEREAMLLWILCGFDP